MPKITLSEPEFRILAYIRAYADNNEQHLDPTWVQEQLNLSLEQMQEASRKFVSLGLATFFEWGPLETDLREYPELTAGIMPMDISLTERGWNCLLTSIPE